MVDDMNDTLPTLYPTRRCIRKEPIPPPMVIAPPETQPFNINETAIKQINIRNLQDNVDLTQRTRLLTQTHHDIISHVTEHTEPVDMARHFPRL